MSPDFADGVAHAVKVGIVLLGCALVTCGAVVGCVGVTGPTIAEREERCRVACKGRPWHYTPPTPEHFGACECEWP